MKSLSAQFNTAMKAVYGIDDNEKVFEALNQERLQFVLLDELMFRYRYKTDLIKAVKERVRGFRLGMDAKAFFVECADEIFRQNLKISVKIPNEDIVTRMKRLHPLWGEPVMPD